MTLPIGEQADLIIFIQVYSCLLQCSYVLLYKLGEYLHLRIYTFIYLVNLTQYLCKFTKPCRRPWNT